jgi:hypothetical protein
VVACRGGAAAATQASWSRTLTCGAPPPPAGGPASSEAAAADSPREVRERRKLAQLTALPVG